MINLFNGVSAPKPYRETQNMRLVAAVIFAGCLTAPIHTNVYAIEPDAPDRLIDSDDVIGMVVRRQLAQTRSGLSKHQLAERKALAAFYSARGNQPVWVGANGLNQRAEKAMSEITNADQWVLPASAFKLPRLALARKGGPALSHKELAKAETMIGMAVLKYARFARGGRTNPARMTEYLDRKPPLLAPKTILEQVSSTNNPAKIIREFNPQHPQFLALRNAYLAMRKGKPADAKPKNKYPIPAGKPLKKGMTHAHVAILRQRLGMAGVDPWQRKLYDDILFKKVRAYQKRNGLGVDGVVGPGTRASLNGDSYVKGDPQKLLVNLEQWRWMPADMGKMHVWVNIPEYKVRVIKDGDTIHKERVVVGKRSNPTPVFSQNLKWVEFHPSWYVPYSIKVKEIGPGYRRRGQTFLDRQGLEVNCPPAARTVQKKKNFWGGFEEPKRSYVDIGKCAVKQPPGPRNVLGVVKFKFPNKHAVYLHDTTSKSLFNKRVRAYSHGCVRVRNPVKLAQIILDYDQGMSSSRINSIVNGPSITHQSYLKKPMPVHVTYFTAFAEKSGRIRYYRDVYGHEERIKLALNGDYDQIRGMPVAKPPAAAQVPAGPPRKKKKQTLFNAIFGGF